ncbi:MAG: hypothetical protein ACT6R2_14725 [Blastomonas fulva]|jgi:hypothetical protein|uniref:hypothetical protein n=1 Tax=Blastomonas TaxID=150203 RepID=UPI000858BC84|nr:MULTISPECIES: hypothetical protein [Blastomonas]AOF99050.1 hypothetical protein BSY18_2682 [Blastomonas sp. RAC04]MDK2756634.1 hypothetical protein [Blastomonas fulva]
MSDTPIEPKPQSKAQPLPRADEARKARLAANLRANLKRRKAQARAMDGSED